MAVATFSLAACGNAPRGSLDPGGLDGVIITGLMRWDDSRDIAFGTTLVNNSATDTITFGGVELIGAHGVEIVDAFTTDMDHQVGIGVSIPPRADDTGSPPGMMENWALRVPLDQTALGPLEVRMLYLVIHPASQDDCLYSQGLRLRYRESRRDITVGSNMAMILYYESSDACSEVDAYLSENPAVP